LFNSSVARVPSCGGAQKVFFIPPTNLSTYSHFDNDFFTKSHCLFLHLLKLRSPKKSPLIYAPVLGEKSVLLRPGVYAPICSTPGTPVATPPPFTLRWNQLKIFIYST